MSGIKGKVIAVTGASSGIGAAAARLLAEQGAHVMLGARRVHRLADLAATIGHAGGSARYLALDVTDRCATQRFVSTAHAWFGRLDVLVNAAGVSLPSRLDALRFDDWDRMIDVNLRGVLHGIAAALPLMQARGRGQFINVAALEGQAALPGSAVRGATQSAVRALSEALRQEVGGLLRVSVVAPGTSAGERLPADAVARAMASAIAQPDGVDVNEIIVRAAA